MPSIDGIVVLLESQFDADLIAEAVMPVDDETQSQGHARTYDIYIPSFLSSQFWISYAIKTEALAATEAQTKYVFFKLMLDGACVASWGVGEADEWKGKTMWAFFREQDAGTGWRAVEKRAFFFRATDEDQDFDLVVYRARGRRRAARQFQDVPEPGEKGFDLINWGRLKDHHPQRFYQYALIDAVDQPYATFRYHVRGGRHVRPSSSTQQTSESDNISDSIDDNIDDSIDSYTSATGAPSGTTQRLPGAAELRRLSYPPSIRFTPTSSGTEPSSPIKLDAEAPTKAGGDGKVEVQEDQKDAEEIREAEHTFVPEASKKEETGDHVDMPREVDGESEVMDKQDEDTSSVNTVIHRRPIVRTPTPLFMKVQNTPPSSMRKRGGAKLRGFFQHAFKRRANEVGTSNRRPITPEVKYTAMS